MPKLNVFRKIRDARGKNYHPGMQSTFTHIDARGLKRGDFINRDGWRWRVLAARFPLVTAVIVED